MSIFVRFLLLMSLIAVPLASFADEGIQPGRYITEGGWGSLKVLQGRDGTLYFDIDTVGSNAHTCGLSGEIHNGKAKLEGEDKKDCVVTFAPTDRGIDVIDSSGGACNYYCGVRAVFTALYLKPQMGCDAESVQKARDDFKRLYDQKDYAQAQAKLEPVVNSCADLILWSDLGSIRNDLAITRHKLGDDAGCRSILQPLRDESGMSDDLLRQSYAPADAEIAIPLAAATRTNLKLCAPEAKKP